MCGALTATTRRTSNETSACQGSGVEKAEEDKIDMMRLILGSPSKKLVENGVEGDR